VSPRPFKKPTAFKPPDAATGLSAARDAAPTKIKQQALRDNIAYFRKKILEQAGTNWLGGSMDSGALS
jgi:hypothetical protein